MKTSVRWQVALVAATSLACLLAACSDRYRDPNDPRKNPETTTTQADTR